MTTLASIKKQIAALEAEAARITRAEMSSAIAKIKDIMTTFGLTAEHLGLAKVRGQRGAAAKSVKKSAPKRVNAGIAKYADPKTGKTWSGLGRVPAWIASAKSRDAFLVDKSSVAASSPVDKPTVVSKKAAAKKTKPAQKVAKPAAKKAKPAAKKSLRIAAEAAPVAAKKKPATKKPASKVPPKKSAAKKATVAESAGVTPAQEPSSGE